MPRNSNPRNQGNSDPSAKHDPKRKSAALLIPTFATGSRVACLLRSTLIFSSAPEKPYSQIPPKYYTFGVPTRSMPTHRNCAGCRLSSMLHRDRLSCVEVVHFTNLTLVTLNLFDQAQTQTKHISEISEASKAESLTRFTKQE